MTNVLIRGLSDAAVERIYAEASALGLSHNEFLRRKLEGAMATSAHAAVTPADWARSAATFGDLADSDVMDAAWR
ncbi:MAG: antitoxin [Micropruina sp.]|uniref:type II toxin-antitoxin system VapB family antitoxin n=1 Tax=Micropruina sp. TaxID=2737536 RepID=UPI0039E655AC